jgi:hypothetical protein
VLFKDFLPGASVSLVLLVVSLAATFELQLSSVDVEDQSAMHLLAAADSAVLSHNGITAKSPQVVSTTAGVRCKSMQSYFDVSTPTPTGGKRKSGANDDGKSTRTAAAKPSSATQPLKRAKKDDIKAHKDSDKTPIEIAQGLVRSSGLDNPAVDEKTLMDEFISDLRTRLGEYKESIDDLDVSNEMAQARVANSIDVPSTLIGNLITTEVMFSQFQRVGRLQDRVAKRETALQVLEKHLDLGDAERLADKED